MNTMTLVLRLTDLDLCRLDSRGCPLLWPLIRCDSRDRVTMGTPSLPVMVPRFRATLDILPMWSLPVEVVCSSRRQLMTSRLSFTACPSPWVWVVSRPTGSVGALLTQSG